MLASMPRFTIITVAFNDLENLKKTRASVLMQEGANYEHIIVDGASTDGTREWLESQAQSDNFRWLSERDHGVYDAMNKGASMARYEYLVFMNAGDTYRDERALRRQQDEMWRRGGLWGYSKAIVVDDRRTPVRPPYGLDVYTPFRHAYARVALCHQATIVNREFFEDLGGFEWEKYEAVADYAFLLRAGLIAIPSIIDSVDVNYLDGGISAVNPDTQILKHRARVGVFQMGPVGRSLDYLFFLYSEGTARARRSLKRTVRAAGGADLITRYASRGQ